MNLYTVDTETCGLTGPVVTIQWSTGGDPVIHEVWRQPADRTVGLIEQIAHGSVLGFNLAFDWYHLQRAWSVLRHLDPNECPTPRGWLEVERRLRYRELEDLCLKPRAACDVFLWARKGKAQICMERDDIRIKRVPRAMAEGLAGYLDGHMAREFPDILFHFRKDGYQWEINEEDDPEFPDLILRFGASSGLKPLCGWLLGADTMDLPVEREYMPKDKKLGWNPFNDSWHHLLDYHVSFWANNARARRYASADVTLTRDLWKHLGSPEPGDIDSTLACQVASVRWRGFKIDESKVQAVRAQTLIDEAAAPTAPAQVRAALLEVLDPFEAAVLTDTRDETLEFIEKEGMTEEGRALAARIRQARGAQKLRDFCDKLLTVGAFHPDYKVVGTLSGRMAGTGGMNATGVPKELRECFVLAEDGERLEGGDFDGFEPAIAEGLYADTKLREDIRSGVKLYCLFGAQILECDPAELTKEADPDRYDQCKMGFLATLYGAQAGKIAALFGITEEMAEAGIARFLSHYEGVGAAQAQTYEDFCSMRQEGGIGTKITWHDAADYVESLFGFRRYFTLENTVCKALFDLAGKVRDELGGDCATCGGEGMVFDPFEETVMKTPCPKCKGKVTRRPGREQTLTGATQSALFACAFQIQARNMRAAGNHRIQSSGAWITKNLQAAVWEHQPVGAHPWVVKPLQVHDEVLVATTLPLGVLHETKDRVVGSFRDRVPLLEMKWGEGLKSWAEK